MENFRVIFNITYKGQNFKVLSNKYFQKYFLKILKDGSLIYPTFDEFRELHILFTNTKCYDIKNQKDTKLVYRKGKGYTEEKRYRLDPNIIMDKYGNKLISLAMAISLINMGIKLIPIVTMNLGAKQLTENVYALENFVDKNNISAKVCDYSEFKKFLKVKNPTYDDVVELITQKENLSNKYKYWLISGLNNLKQELGDIDLSVLYYNIARMQILNKSYNEMEEDSKIKGTVATFKPITGEVYINENEIDSTTFLHEVLGHGLTEGYIDGKAYTTFTIPAFSKIDKYYYVFGFGHAFEEAKAELISEIASGIPIQYHDNGYSQSIEALRIIMKTTNLTLADVIKHGGVSYLIDKMKENDIDYPLEHIENFDAFFTMLKNSSKLLPVEIPGEEYDFTNSLEDYMIDFVDEKIARGESQEKLGEEVYQIINDSYYDFVTDGQRMINMGAVAYSVKDMVESKALSMLISGDEKNEVIVIDDNLIDHIDMLDEDR